MLIFFFIVFIYGLSNLYTFFKITSFIDAGMVINITIGAVVLFMTMMPVFIPIYSNRGKERYVRIFAYIGYFWLALLVTFFPASVIIDIYNLVIKDPVLMVSSDNSFYIPLVLSMAINLYGYYEAGCLKTEHLVIKTSKLPKNINRIRIAQISDLHLGIIVRDKMVDKVIRKIEAESPDIIVSTGDLMDGNVRHIKHLAPMLNKMRAPLGKFAVMGNHEVYGGVRHTTRFTEDAGFKLLRGEGVTIGDRINIAGMDFLGGEAREHAAGSDQRPEKDIISALPRELFTLLLKHRSDVEKESLGLFDLQLSGHTHKGQIFPMNLATMFLFSYHTGFAKLAKGSAIYTSRGTGTAGPPIRFLSTPEITIFDIVKSCNLR